MVGIHAAHYNENYLSAAALIAYRGAQAQEQKINLISSNISAHGMESTGPYDEKNPTKNDPPRRKIGVFKKIFNTQSGLQEVHMVEVLEDKTPFKLKYDPNHVGADKNGNVKVSNVVLPVEKADLDLSRITYQSCVNMAKMMYSLVDTVIKNLLKN